MRLSDVRQQYGERVRIHWRTFPLIPGEQPDRRVTQKTRDGRAKVGGEEPGARFVPPEIGAALPASSIPALTAAKCAERQGEDAFERFHRALFTAHFGENLDISRHDVLWALAQSCALDMERFKADFAGEAYQAVLHDCAEGAAWFGVSALPTVVFNEKVSLVGAVTTERYRELIDWILAGEPGGVIQIGFEPGVAAMPGHSAVGGTGT